MNVDINTAKEIVQYAVQERLNVLLVGAPGCGKSAIVEQTATEMERPLLTFHPSVQEPIDYAGMQVYTGTGIDVLPAGQLKQLCEAESETIAFIDDVGQAMPQTQAALMQLIWARSVGELKVSDKVSFVAATNRSEDAAAVYAMPEPVKSRFIIIHVEASAKAWVKWAIQKDVSPELIGWAQFKPSYLEDWEPIDGFENRPTPRAYQFADRILKTYPRDPYALLAGVCGPAWATEFSAFRSMYMDLPSLDEIVQKQWVPERVDLMYAVIVSLARHANNENSKAVFGYVKNLKPVHGELMVTCVSILDNADGGNRMLMPGWNELIVAMTS